MSKSGQAAAQVDQLLQRLSLQAKVVQGNESMTESLRGNEWMTESVQEKDQRTRTVHGKVLSDSVYEEPQVTMPTEGRHQWQNDVEMPPMRIMGSQCVTRRKTR